MTEDNLRVDKWLWSVRIFKTRSQAANACKKDKVLINGFPVKPSRIIKINEEIEVKINPITYRYRVKDLLSKRLGAKLVVNYVENITTDKELQKLEMLKSSPFAKRKKGLGRPTKKERRVINKINPDID